MATWTKWGELMIDTGVNATATVSGYGYGYVAKVRASQMTRSVAGSGNARPYRVAITSKVMVSMDFNFGTTVPQTIANGTPGRVFISCEIWADGTADEYGGTFTIEKVEWELVRLN